MTQEINIIEGGNAARNITLSDGNLICSVITDKRRLQACFRLRYLYFVHERGWVAREACSEGLERDDYDRRTLHLVVFENDEALAYLRVLPHEQGYEFMLDREFAGLISEEERQRLPRVGAVELSRLVCRCDLFRRATAHPVELLLKLLYRVSREQGYGRFYIVVEESWLKPFARRFGLPFRVLGQPYVFSDGTRTVAATATLEELEAAMKTHSRAKHAWYQDEALPLEMRPGADG